MLSVDPSSRFQLTDAISVVTPEGNVTETFGMWVRPSFLRTRPSSELIRRMVVPASMEGRPHIIADQIYGTQLLDWVIIAFNNAYDVLNWPDAGTTIEYPEPSIVFSSIG